MNFVTRATRCCVQSGPFRGMRYVVSACGSEYCPKLLGTYEKELHSILAEVSKKRYSAVVDIGCGEGYYSIGLARLLSASSVWACDIDPEARLQVAQLGRLNNVDNRVFIGGDWQQLGVWQSLVEGEKILVKCDVEGEESVILNPETCSAFRNSDVIVEVHDASTTGGEIAELLEGRFSQSHRIRKVPFVGRSAADWPLDTWAPPSMRLDAVEERRHYGVMWMYMEARSSELVNEK